MKFAVYLTKAQIGQSRMLTEEPIGNVYSVVLFFSCKELSKSDLTR